MIRNFRSIVKGSLKKSLAKSRLATAALVIGLGAAALTVQAQSIDSLLAPQLSVALPPVNPIAEPQVPQYPANPIQQQVPAQQAPQQAAPQATARLTLEQLGQVLDAIQTGKNTCTANGDTFYTLTIKQGTWTIPLTINLSPSGNVLWISTTLTHITDPSKVSAAAMMNLLQKNADLGPMFFQIVGNDHGIQLTEPIANYGLSVDAVRGRIADFIQVIRQTESLWSDQTIMPVQAAMAPGYPNR